MFGNIIKFRTRGQSCTDSSTIEAHEGFAQPSHCTCSYSDNANNLLSVVCGHKHHCKKKCTA